MTRLKPQGHNLIDPEQKKLYLEMLDHWKGLNDRANSASAKRRQYEGEVKKAGFSVKMFKDSMQLATPEGEAEFKAEMANRMLAAAYMDADIGDQLSLFLEPGRTPAVDRAYREGQTAAMENRRAKPKYSPESDQHAAYMKGYHDEQERQVLKGISKKEGGAGEGEKSNGKKGAKGKKTAAAPAAPAKKRGRPAGSGKKAGGATSAPRAAKDTAPPRRPPAQPVTRSTMAAAEGESDSYFTKSSETAGNA